MEALRGVDRASLRQIQLAGRTLAFDRSRGGSCVACHILGESTPEFPGNVGPDLSTLGATRDPQMMFAYTYDARSFFPLSIMPPWGTHGLYTTEELVDIVAFLASLKTPMKFKDELDDPTKRIVPKETRDNLDDFENPGMDVVPEGKKLFAARGPKNKSCLDCHAAPEQAFKTWAARMPRYEPRLQKVLGVEEFVTRHAMATTGDAHLMESEQNIALSVYLKFLANGAVIDVDVASPEAKAAAERGRALTQRKIGQLNFACTDCHERAANRWIRGQWLTGMRGQVGHFPTWRNGRGEVWDLRKRFQWCNVAIRANELPPDAPEYGDLELYLTSLSNGLTLSVPGIRN